MKNLISVATYARAKKISTTTVYNWIESGKLKMVEIDGKKFIDISKTK